MNVNDKYVLHNVAFPWIHSDKIDKIVIVEVVEVKTDVADMWTGEKIHTGLKAKDENGTEYFCNWDSFPSDSMTPYWSWYCPEPSETWYDITYVTGQGHKPEKVPEIIANQDFIKYCTIHEDFYYTRNGTGCFDCYMENKYGKKLNAVNTVKNNSPWGNWHNG